MNVQEQIALEKQRLKNLKMQKEEYLHDNALLYFKPNKKQMSFIENAAIPRRAGYCGNRFGKSTLGVVEDCCWLLGYRPFFPEGHPLRTLGIPEHGVKGVVLGEDWEKIKEIFTDNESLGDRRGKFFHFLPKWSISKTRKNQNGTINVIYVTSEINGRKRESVVHFDTVRSFKSNALSAESSDWDFIHCDEPIPEAMWNAVSRGLIDRGGFSWWLMTPLKEAWMYYQIVDGAKKEPETYWYFTADMTDNPLNDPKSIELFLRNLTPEERDCRQRGMPMAFGSLVYPYYDEIKHLVKGVPYGWLDSRTPPQSYSVEIAIDPHPQTPHAVLFVATAPTGQVYFFDEIFEKSKVSELAKKVLNKMSRFRCVSVICDPIAWNDDPETGRCWADILHEHGLPVQKASKQKTAGIIETNDFWREREVRVMEHMSIFRSEIRNYVFDRENKPVDKDDHMMECMYRLVMRNSLRHQEEYDFNEPVGSVNIEDNINLQVV